MSNDASRSFLRDLIQERSIKVVPLDQEFTLSSGEKSRVYCDLKKSALRHEAAEALASLVLDAVSKFGPVEAFAGVALGGCHLASTVSVLSDRAAAIHVRKEAKGHGTGKLVEAPDLAPGAPVVLLEDVTTTANSALKALEALRAEGYNVVAVVTVVDRREAWSSKAPPSEIGGIPLVSLFRIEEFVPERPEYTALQEAADHSGGAPAV